MKKIDVSKSLIFSRNIEDLKNSLEYLNQEGYFSNSKEFSVYEEGKLGIVRVSNIENFVFNPYAFVRDGFRYSFSYFIPKLKAVFVEEPKKKKLRPFKSIDEFFSVTGFKIGEVVQIKNFGNFPYEEKSIINGFRVYNNETYVVFGAGSRSLDELFKHFKYYKNGEWCRFGVED